MCGIFGYIGRIKKNHNEAFRLLSALAIESEARGVDATGFSCRTSLSGEVVSDKMPIKASKFVTTSSQFRSLLNGMPDTFIGHTRLGTGSSPKINNNNHPFFGRQFNMVHNGVIPSWRNLKDKHNLNMMSETDSEIILRSFEKQLKLGNTVTQASEWVLNTIWGNMAVALLDKTSPSIWLFRNENPIVIFEVDKKEFGNPITFFASTKDIFDKAWRKVFFFRKGPDETVLDDNCSYRLSMSGNTNTNHCHLDSFEISVKNKFRKAYQYLGWEDYEDYYRRGTTSAPPQARKIFTTSVCEISKPSLGNELSIKDAAEIADLCKDKGGRESVRIDNLTIDEFGVARSVSLVIATLDRELKGALQTSKGG